MTGVCCSCCSCTDAQVEACQQVTCSCSNDSQTATNICELFGCEGDFDTKVPSELSVMSSEMDRVLDELNTAVSAGSHRLFSVPGIHPEVALRLQTILTKWQQTIRGLIVN